MFILNLYKSSADFSRNQNPLYIGMYTSIALCKHKGMSLMKQNNYYGFKVFRNSSKEPMFISILPYEFLKKKGIATAYKLENVHLDELFKELLELKRCLERSLWDSLEYLSLYEENGVANLSYKTKTNMYSISTCEDVFNKESKEVTDLLESIINLLWKVFEKPVNSITLMPKLLNSNWYKESLYESGGTCMDLYFDMSQLGY